MPHDGSPLRTVLNPAIASGNSNECRSAIAWSNSSPTDAAQAVSKCTFPNRSPPGRGACACTNEAETNVKTMAVERTDSARILLSLFRRLLLRVLSMWHSGASKCRRGGFQDLVGQFRIVDRAGQRERADKAGDRRQRLLASRRRRSTARQQSS